MNFAADYGLKTRQIASWFWLRRGVLSNQNFIWWWWWRFCFTEATRLSERSRSWSSSWYATRDPDFRDEHEELGILVVGWYPCSQLCWTESVLKSFQTKIGTAAKFIFDPHRRRKKFDWRGSSVMSVKARRARKYLLQHLTLNYIFKLPWLLEGSFTPSDLWPLTIDNNTMAQWRRYCILTPRIRDSSSSVTKTTG